VDSDRYTYKLLWLERLRDWVREQDPSRPLVVCGDFNIAPEDRDVFDPGVWRGKVLTSEPERARFRELLSVGLSDALRLMNEGPGVYTWWDYRLGAFRRNLGLRIDHLLVSRRVAERVREVVVDREERGGAKPSDHAPVIARLDPP
jgi:exodeoxyribonuclease-3